MAVTAEELIFKLTAKVAGFEDEMSVAAATFNKAAQKIEAGFGRMDRQIEESSRKNTSNIKAMTAALTGFLGAREVMAYADAWSNAKNALVAAKVPLQQQAGVLGRLYDQAQDYGVQLNAQVSLYSQVSRAASQLTGSAEDVFRFTEAVAVSLRADGKSAQEASGSLLQLGQALRSPIIQAEEFNSLIDGTPSLLEAAANGIQRFNGDMGALIKAAKSGTLTSREFFQGVLAGSEDIKTRMGASADTFDRAFVKIGNALTRYIGQTDESLSASQRLIAGLNAFADDFDRIADNVLKLAAVISGALVGRAIGGALTTIPLAIIAFRLLSLASTGAAQAAGFMAVNFGNATKAIAGATLASRAFKIAALGYVAGPIGAVVGTIATAFVAFSDTIFGASDSTDLASISADKFAERLRLLGAAADNSAKKVDDAGTRYNEAMKRALGAEVDVGTQQLDEATEAAASLLKQIAEISGARIITEDQRSTLAKLGEDLQSGKKSAEEVKNELNALANADPKFGKLADQMNPLLDKIIQLLGGLRQVKAEFAAVSSADYVRDRATQFQIDPGYNTRQFIAEQERRNSLTKEQLSLEEEIASVRKKASAEGAVLTNEQATALAKSNLAAAAARSASGKSRTKRDEFAEETKSVQERIDALNAEIMAYQSVNPLQADYEKRILAAKSAHELLTAAQEGGKEVGKELTDVQKLLYGDLSALSPKAREQAETIRAMALGYADATTRLNALREAQDKAKESAREAIEFQKDLLNGALSDMRTALEDGKLTWKDLGNVAVNVLNKIADKLQQMLVDQLFSKGFMGLFGSFLGMGGSMAGVAGAGATGIKAASTAAAASAMKAPALANVPSAAQVAKAQAVTVDVRAYFDDSDGKLKTEIERVSGGVSAQAVKAGFARYRAGGVQSDIARFSSNPRRR